MMTRHAWPSVLPVGALLAVLIGSTAGAAEMTVNNLEDTVTGEGACTLREAINNANGNRDTTGGDCPSGSPATPDTIRFAVSGTIILGSTLPAISDPAGLTIDGTGQSLTVSGNNAVGVITVETGATLKLTGLTVANGSWSADSFPNAGGIFNQGTLTVVNSIFSNNYVLGTGGGINNWGTLTITHSTFSGNRAKYGRGGGIGNSGTLTITDSTFADNHSEQFEGGGIDNSGTLTITDSTFTGNVSGGDDGGGIRNDGTLTITNSTFSKNESSQGGGIENNGTAIITNSTFTENSAAGGAGIRNWGTLTVTGSTFTGNRGHGGSGAGIRNGIRNRGTLTIANSTFAGNSTGGDGYGGGIYNEGNSLTVVNSTFAGNRAGSGGADYTTSGGGIYNATGSLTLANTILANNAGGDCFTQNGLIPAGINLVQDGSCGASADPVHFLTGDPMLGALTDNGGPTATVALQPGSPAIDKADDTICAAPLVNSLDQRGVNRPQQGGAHCDIGAFELIQSGPDCSKAKPSKAWLWPPNHRFVPIRIVGVIPPPGDSVTIRVDSIRQDEAVTAKGSGHTAPDGQGIGTSTAQVRAERVGDRKVPGNGRVYHISFTAEDGQGGSCIGEVRVGVPPDQGTTPVDDGALYDSALRWCQIFNLSSSNR